MHKLREQRSIAVLIFLLCFAVAFAQKASHRLDITLTDKGTRETIVMATVQLQPLGAMAVTDADGRAVIDRVPAGDYTLRISYVGYEPLAAKVTVDRDLQLAYRLQPTSLALSEVTVTARQNASGSSTSSIIGRQAIDHLQATSLADVMQLIPGHLMGNSDMLSASNLQLRQLVNNNTSAFGASIVVDGVPMSNNGVVTQGTFSSTAFVGTDLRQVSADDIDEVEVVRGIPSAEYGDLTSGLVVVHSKAGVTPWQVKGKVTPGLQNISAGKGLKMGRAGVLNFNLDYASAWGDPRQKTRTFGRYTGTLTYTADPTRHWHTTTKLRLMQARDWSGNDPDAKQDGKSDRNRHTTFSLNHNGRLTFPRAHGNIMNYTLGLSLTQTDARTTSYVAVPTGLLPILTARETGYYDVPFMRNSYLATGITEGRPGNLFVKLSDQQSVKLGRTRQTLKAGVEYHLDWNSGRGYYNADELLPFRPNNDGRPRAFSDIPALHQLAAYAEDQLLWQMNKVNRLRLTAGVRLTAMQPFANVATTALSPRLNAGFSVTKWLELRGGIGMNAKTPSLAYLYPDKKYADHLVANYFPANAVEQLLTYYTHVYDVAYSRGLRNATTTKTEVGVDFRLPSGKKLSIIAYRDRTPNGFGAATEYTTYIYNVYDQHHGLVTATGQPTTINYADPARTDTVFMTTGKVGNTNTTVNRGVEFDFDCGRITALNTSIYLSGAYSETKTWSTNLNTASPRSALLPVRYSSEGLTPFKVVYPSGQDYSLYRRFVVTLRAVTNVPVLRMVASLTAQAVAYNYSMSYVAPRTPTGWIDTDLEQHNLTPDMLDGYIGMDGRYYTTKPEGQTAVSVRDLETHPNDNVPSKAPMTWNTSLRLTKELGTVGGFSFYVNNALYYEPYLRGNNTRSLTQRNTGTFNYGVELHLNL